MTQQEKRGNGNGQAGATADGQRRLEDFTEARDEIWDCLQDANRVWLERMQQEAVLTAELASKLTTSRSLTDTATALQDWTSKHFEMTTEDARRLFTDAQQMVNAGARFWSNSARVASPETAGRIAS